MIKTIFITLSPWQYVGIKKYRLKYKISNKNNTKVETTRVSENIKENSI